MPTSGETIDPKLQALTIEQVAKRMQVSRPTVYRWIRSGSLRLIKLGGGKAARVMEADLLAFIDQSAVKNEKQPRRSGKHREYKPKFLSYSR